ncbi:ABC transporter ATP-binding protein [Gottschalkia acidurici 9a]|uniref:ABC transporter ATP-binding protein n=1 Tax=Gottschalkia acidurici (strain ATCC 7906 / DSM 604 / BCRC 14475 / CIP 104303 / KCTC 5404 / NCIMB 10678 / 9a) TaxID=1128398 RepID=K0B155_GOTA9|nr:ABC transporter ATP-binding protein [Gottschalkia acidurici]AFS79748.1 ABC transporter ATP-binding protein [Gottschalkia acidurici 9a]
MEIKISNLTKRFGTKTVLDNINLEIPSGMFGLLGRNGAGKTTLMRILTTLLIKNEGSVTICGVPVENTKDIRKTIGYLPQDFSMYPNMTVYEVMDYLGILSEIPKHERKDIILKLLDKVNLLDCKKVRVKALSGGMKRRLGIAQAIMHNPKVLIVDEPTAGLDPEERIRFRNLLCEIAKDRIIILSTHIVGDIEATCENIAILNSGTVIYSGTTNELKELASNKVYTVTKNHKDLNKIKDKYIVTSMISQGVNATLRIISDSKPDEDAVPCEPTIEDGYMLLMGGQAK